MNNPTEKEIAKIFNLLITNQGIVYQTKRKLEDEEGLYLWEVDFSTKRGLVEYCYTRKGTFESSDTVIDVAFYNNDGEPYNGSSVAKYVDGKWFLTIN